MNRRTLLRRSSALSVAFLAGCNDAPSSGSAVVSPTSSPESTTEQPTESATMTADDTPQLAVEQQYELGESHRFNDWTIAVTSVTLDTTFRLDDDEATYGMPEGEQLAIVTLEVTNRTGSRKTWTDTPIVMVADGLLFDGRLGFEHPEFDEPVQMDDLTRIDHMRRYAPSGHPVEGNETVRSWLLFVLPGDLAHDQIEVGFDGDGNDGSYPIRWVP